jgi:hypothetical protein
MRFKLVRTLCFKIPDLVRSCMMVEGPVWEPPSFFFLREVRMTENSRMATHEDRRTPTQPLVEVRPGF